MEIYIGSVLGLNLLGSAVYALIRKIRKKEYFSALFFIFLPVLGFLLFLLPLCIFKLLPKQQYDRESLVKRFVFSKSQEFPSMQKELDVVPILDAMTVSENDEKRELLLEELKKDFSTNYKVLLPAGRDSDSETAHYIAAAKMEVYRLLQDKWIKSWIKWKNEQEEECLHEVFEALEELISSQLLAAKEEVLYKEKYINLLLKEISIHSEFITEKEISSSLSYLIELKKYKEAKSFYEKYKEKCRNETAYQKLLEMWYEEGNKEEFYKVINQLRKDEQVRLSPEGLSSLRFWLKKEM